MLARQAGILSSAPSPRALRESEDAFALSRHASGHDLDVGRGQRNTYSQSTWIRLRGMTRWMPLWKSAGHVLHPDEASDAAKMLAQGLRAA